jgi:Tfp pilus assembly protein PilV
VNQRARIAAASQAGLTVVEVLVAMVLLVVGLVAALGVFSTALRESFGAQRRVQLVSLAQREMERLQAQPFDLLELDAYPTAVADPGQNPGDPRAFVQGNSLRILTSYHDQASVPPAGSAASEELVVDPDADPAADGVSVAPTSEGVPIGSPGGEQATATVHRFISRRDEDCTLSVVGLPLADLCPAEQGAKRITVAITAPPAGNRAGPNKPVYLSTVVTDPDAAPLDLPL